MPIPACSDHEFAALWKTHGSATAIASILGCSVRSVFNRRKRLERILAIPMPSVLKAGGAPATVIRHEGKIDLEIDNGVVIVFSDAHFWPEFKTTANRALVAMIQQMRPVATICNGDAFDGATISRFPRPFFDEGKPTVSAELKVCDERLEEIYQAHPKGRHIWNLGNHDTRYEAKLAAQAPEYQGVKGFHLKDWFPRWEPAWSTWVNGSIEIRHRYRSGIHATHNNVMANHHTTITGHLHSLQVRPYTDGRGTIKYGVDTGTLADADGPQFADYLEGRQPNWRSGFVVLTVKDGELLMPELVLKYDEDHVQFRGHVLHADTLAIV